MRFPPLDKNPADYTPDEVECLLVAYNRIVKIACERRDRIIAQEGRLVDAYARCGRTQRALGKSVEEVQRLLEILEKIDRVTQTAVRNGYLVGLVETLEALLGEVYPE